MELDILPMGHDGRSVQFSLLYFSRSALSFWGEHLGATDLLKQRKIGLGKSNTELFAGKPHAVLANIVDFSCDLPKKFERQIGKRMAVADWWHAWIPE